MTLVFGETRRKEEGQPKLVEELIKEMNGTLTSSRVVVVVLRGCSTVKGRRGGHRSPRGRQPRSFRAPQHRLPTERGA